MRIGKYVELSAATASTAQQAEPAHRRDVPQLLANGVIEDYRFEIVEGARVACAGE